VEACGVSMNVRLCESSNVLELHRYWEKEINSRQSNSSLAAREVKDSLQANEAHLGNTDPACTLRR
jgi:hypothetical protein